MKLTRIPHDQPDPPYHTTIEGEYIVLKPCFDQVNAFGEKPIGYQRDGKGGIEIVYPDLPTRTIFFL